MFRYAMLGIALCANLALACDDGGPDGGQPVQPGAPSATVRVQVSPPPKPGGVPDATSPIVETSTLGRITRRAEEEPRVVALRTIEGGGCNGDVLTIRTSEETIYAALPCERFSSDVFEEQYAGEQAALVLEVTADRFRVLIETLEGAQAEFTVGGIWVE